MRFKLASGSLLWVVAVVLLAGGHVYAGEDVGANADSPQRGVSQPTNQGPIAHGESPAKSEQDASTAPENDQAKAQSQGDDEDAAKEKNDQPERIYIRISRDEKDKPVSLDTSIVTFKPAGKQHEGVTIDLIGAVHIADADYYQRLNKQFESYDVLLYELVAPEGTRIPKGGRKQGGSAIGALQGGMSSLLELEHQLHQVDYTKKNFVHADMSPEEFAKSMKDRDESFLKMFFRAMGQSAAMQATGKQPISDADVLFALLSKDRALRLKRLFARQFENMESSMTIFDDGEGSTLITERNKKCLEVLKQQLDKGQKHIGVFYGAGHLADMEKRLADDFGMRRAGEKWFVAWDLQAKSGKSSKDAPKNKDDATRPQSTDEGAPLKKAS